MSEIKNIRNVGISTICEINDLINSFNEIIDTVFDFSDIDRIFVKLFKKANYFEIYIEHLKKVENLDTKSLILMILLIHSNEIIDKILIFSTIDKIFVELFKKAKLFEICIEHFKRGEKLITKFKTICCCLQITYESHNFIIH